MILRTARCLPAHKALWPLHRAKIRAATTRSAPTPYQPRSKDDISPPPKPRPSYKQLERRWVGVMVGLPICLVSGWTLYKREVLGEDARLLVPKAEVAMEKKTEVEEGGIKDPKTGRRATIF